MSRLIQADYLVVGAGAMGMAFVDALLDHAEGPGPRVVIVDRRHGPGGHWLEAYPFVRLHQASTFYGVASTLLGGGRLQERGPEEGLQERATQAEILAYYARRLDDLVATGKVEFLGNCEYRDDGTVESLVSGQQWEVTPTCRVVNARHLAPGIPAEMPAPFAVGGGVRVVGAHELPRTDRAADRYVVVGSGKTATDTCIWLLDRGVDPEAICWIRPREPWMIDRAVMQPDPAVFTGTSADILQSAATASSLEEWFLTLEDRGLLVRLDRSVPATMAKVPTLGRWELELLRTIGNVLRRGHLLAVERGRLVFADGEVAVPEETLVVHCAADGLRNPELLPIWRPEDITLQTVRSGFPCFGAALIGYVEATRRDDEAKNRLCPPNAYGNSMADWARMNLRGVRAVQSFMAEDDIRDWAHRVAINPARIPPEYPGSPALDAARERVATYVGPALDRLEELT